MEGKESNELLVKGIEIDIKMISNTLIQDPEEIFLINSIVIMLMNFIFYSFCTISKLSM